MIIKKQEGQVLLIVVLVTVVALTIGLAVISRSVTNLEVSRQSEESQRAFQAAETGVEQAIQSVRLSPTPPAFLDLPPNRLSNEAEYDAQATVVQGTEFLLNGGNPVAQNAGLDVWLSEYPDYTQSVSDTVEIFWNVPDQNSCSDNDDFADEVEPALEVLLLSGDLNNPTFEKYLFDGCNTRTPGADDPTDVLENIDDATFLNAASISVSNGLLMKVIPIYNSGVIGVSTNGVALPPQGVLVESVGSSGESVRKLVVFESYPQIPTEFFQYTILSQ